MAFVERDYWGFPTNAGRAAAAALCQYQKCKFGGYGTCVLTTRSSGPANIVGRVWPRHGQRGRPLSSVIRQHFVEGRVDPDSSNEHLREIARLQAEQLAVQKQFLANQEQDMRMRKRSFRFMLVFIVIYVVLSLAPIWLWN
jgi:hypothetical protein